MGNIVLSCGAGSWGIAWSFEGSREGDAEKSGRVLHCSVVHRVVPGARTWRSEESDEGSNGSMVELQRCALN